jgi:uncharacterized protein DUF6283
VAKDRPRRRPKVTRRTPVDQDHQVVTIEGGNGHRYRPCGECPWKVANAGTFPAEAFRVSAHTAYDAAMSTFACHEAGMENPKTCAGFLLRNAANSLAVRIAVARGRFDLDSLSDGGHELHDCYVDMAIANGVDPEDPVLAPCRADHAESVWRPATARPRRPDEVRRSARSRTTAAGSTDDSGESTRERDHA